MRTTTRRGVALMLALWLIVVLGAIAAGVAAATRSEADRTLAVRARSVARYAAESGVEAARSEIARLLTGSPEERVASLRRLDEALAPLHESDVGDGRFDVTAVDLGGRVDLNQARDETLRGLLTEFTSDDASRALVAALRDWRDPDDVALAGGAEAGDYRRAGSPFVPTNGALRMVDELTRIRGFDDSLARAVAPYVTVDGAARINVNAAPETVLAAVHGVGPTRARALLDRRESEGVFTSLSEVLEVLGGGAAGASALLELDVVPTRILVISRGWQPGRPLTHEIQAVFELSGANLRLAGWRERDL